MKDTKIKLSLIGLDCANCANKIENKINSLDEVKEANLNFSMGTLFVELIKEKEIDEAKDEIEKIVHSFEPDVKVEKYKMEIKRCSSSNKCCEGHHHEHGKEKHDHNHEEGHDHNHESSNLDKILLLLGSIILVVALFFKEEKYALGIFLTSYLLIGGEVLLSAFRNILKGRVFDENFLMTLATIGAFIIGEYPEAVAVMLFYKIGEYFQGRAVNKSRKSISSLMDIKADYTNLLIGNTEKKVAPEEVSIGDTIIIRPGERVPLDGILIDGETTFDTSALTGESKVRSSKKNEEVLSGYINLSGVIKLKVTKEFEDSTVARILELVENANSKKATTEKFITRFSQIYTPIVVILALIVAVIPPLVLEGAEFADWIYRSLIFLVVSCPCALVISVPLSIFAGIGNASKNGVLIKGGNYLESLNNVETIVFDKTGTLTKGIFKVTKINPINIEKNELLKIAAYGECFSNHPIANSIIDSYGKEIDKTLVKNYKEISGHGISVEIANKHVLLGNDKLMKANSVKYTTNKEVGTLIHVAIEKEYKGYIIISDEIKETSKEAILGLKNIGIKQTVMLTGDNKVIAESVGKELGIDKVYSQLLPSDKVERVEELLNKNKKKGNLIFVGDGINDAPVLARADIGIAMGGIGSDAAIEASDVVLMKDDILSIIAAIKVAKKTHNIMWQNIIFSLGIKIFVLILGIFGITDIWEGVFADVGVTLIAILNSMRILKYKI